MSRERCIGLAIRKARQANKLTQEKLAEVAGLHKNAVGLIERYEIAPTTDTLFKIADALGISASEIVASAELLARQQN
ncbi:helix-turn-helix domain-containing protein [Neisseriaceae bacterium JH1-16]|nr:helix-turn-helix domain-containing protein [Neisseriaceae bacterium JH1-16]